MACGWSKYSLGGKVFYIVAIGDGRLEELLLREESSPDCAGDDNMMKVAELARRWILEGNVSAVDIGPNATPFQRKVYEAISKIPKGSVSTYSSVAKAIGCKGSRAVGQALKKNSIPLFIPCHRVVRKDGSLGGFECGPDIKEQILRKEGIRITNGKVDPSQIIYDL
ncbi:MAG: MGMT family protein [Candidatus Methanofastidiosa archaeon]|nr:MGMT family protein [Candidatus Methanofastidiosa archaeon]